MNSTSGILYIFTYYISIVHIFSTNTWRKKIYDSDDKIYNNLMQHCIYFTVNFHL